MSKSKIGLLLFCLLLPAALLGQGFGHGGGGGGSDLAVEDEGSQITSAATGFDFVGAGVTATVSGSEVTVTVPGSGSATFTVRESGSTLSTTISVLDFLSGFDLTESPSGEANISLDFTEDQIDLTSEVTGVLPEANGGSIWDDLGGVARLKDVPGDSGISIVGFDSAQDSVRILVDRDGDVLITKVAANGLFRFNDSVRFEGNMTLGDGTDTNRSLTVDVVGSNDPQLEFHAAEDSVTLNKELVLADGTGSSPPITHVPATGTQWQNYTDDGSDDFYIESNTTSTERVVINNADTGVADLEVEGTANAATLTEGGNAVPNVNETHTWEAAQIFLDDGIRILEPARNDTFTISTSSISGNVILSIPTLTGTRIFTFNDNIATLSSKTISGSSNTITDIGQDEIETSGVGTDELAENVAVEIIRAGATSLTRNDTITFIAGSNVTLTPSNDSLTIAASGGSGTSLETQIDGGSAATATEIYDWSSASFSLTESPANDFDIDLNFGMTAAWTGAHTWTRAGLAGRFQNTTDAASNVHMEFWGGNRATPANNDESIFDFYLDNDLGTQQSFAQMQWIADDVTNTTKDGRFRWAVMVNNTMTDILDVHGAGATVVGTLAATTVTGANVTSSNNPGHTHSSVALDSVGADGVRTNTQVHAQDPLFSIWIDIPDSLESDTLWVWRNTKGATVTIDSIYGESATDDYTVSLYESDPTGGNIQTVDVFDIANNGAPHFYTTETTITGASIQVGNRVGLLRPPEDGDFLKLDVYGSW